MLNKARATDLKGLYIYCIVEADKDLDFGNIGIGNRQDRVFSLGYRDIAAVVSESPVTKYPITRDNTLSHQLVMEEALKKRVVLPVRFGTIAEVFKDEPPQERVRRMLKDRYDELRDLCRQMNAKAELGLKAMWIDMPEIFNEIVRENTKIAKLRSAITKGAARNTHEMKVALGEMVKSALEAKKTVEKERILERLTKLSVDRRDNKTFGDRMFLNSALLVETAKERAFDEAVEALIAKQNGRASLKYVGPTPPCNFVEIEIDWKKEYGHGFSR